MLRDDECLIGADFGLSALGQEGQQAAVPKPTLGGHQRNLTSMDHKGHAADCLCRIRHATAYMVAGMGPGAES